VKTIHPKFIGADPFGPGSACGARLWSQTQPQRAGIFQRAAAGALHTYLSGGAVGTARGTARCAVRAPFEGRKVCVTCTCGAIGSARSDAPGDTAARCPYPRNRYSHTAALRLGAFTLVELLTVIAIIAVLATLLMTAVASAGRKSRTAVSTFNLHQISLALDMYLDDIGKRPPGAEELVSSKYLTGPRSLLCPEDRTGNWGPLVETASSLQSFSSIPSDPQAPPIPTPPLPALQRSYLLHPLTWNDDAWNRLLQEGSSAGLAACQLHGLGRQDLLAPTVRNFEGLLLRAQHDGAVVRRHIFWDKFPPPGDSAAAFPDAVSSGVGMANDYPWQIYIDGSTNGLPPRP